MSELEPGAASTTAAASAAAQTRAGEGDAAEVVVLGAAEPAPREGVDFEIGAGVERGARGLPYERRPDDPLYRPLRIYTQDPAASRLEGAVALVNVPYEPLAPGPVGAVIAVDSDSRSVDTLDRARFR